MWPGTAFVSFRDLPLSAVAVLTVWVKLLQLPAFCLIENFLCHEAAVFVQTWNQLVQRDNVNVRLPQRALKIFFGFSNVNTFDGGINKIDPLSEKSEFVLIQFLLFVFSFSLGECLKFSTFDSVAESFPLLLFSLSQCYFNFHLFFYCR